MNNKQLITCLKKSEIRQIHGGVGEEEKEIAVVVATTALGAVAGGYSGAVAGYKIATTGIKAYKKWKKR
ncbi:MAG: hypothetical protein WCH10_02415 [bacterium]